MVQADQPVDAVTTTFNQIYYTCFPTDYFKTKTITFVTTFFFNCAYTFSVKLVVLVLFSFENYT